MAKRIPIRSRTALDRLATRIEMDAAWGSVVPRAPSRALRALGKDAARKPQRTRRQDSRAATQARGTVALFTGPDAAAKTAALAALGQETGRVAYRVDLSRIVGKYIGETEKHLSRIFDAAAGLEVILFFDEADALFGKRREVADAHDRYANLEVGYLLGRIDAHHGLVVLATNRHEALDEALLRRIRFTIHFPLPDAG